MLEFTRRMPRIERIPFVVATKENVNDLVQITLDPEKITAIRLRYTKALYDNFDKITINVHDILKIQQGSITILVCWLTTSVCL